VVRHEVRDKLTYAFETWGSKASKNMARPVRAYAMNAAAVESILQSQAIQSVANTKSSRARHSGGTAAFHVVLPFANLSNDPEQEYFADGITMT